MVDELSRGEKISLVNETYNTVLKELGEYAPFVSLDCKLEKIKEKLPEKPIYGFKTIIQIMGGHFDVPEDKKQLMIDLIAKVRAEAPNEVSNKYVALTVRELLPKKSIYDKGTIKQIITRQYK
jgi:hypothetical protein